MTRENNIFYNLVKNETSVTELFCNLMSFKPFRLLFLNMIKEKGRDINLEKIGYDCFDTEISLGKDEKKHGRADILLSVDQNDEYIFEIKIESWCNLTGNQPESYLNYLNNDNERLIFIIPENYYHIEEICERWKKHTDYGADNIKENSIIFWEEILKKIKDAELDKLNLFISEFVEIMNSNWLYYEEIDFTIEEVKLLELKESEEDYLMENSNVPKLINKIFKVIEGVKLSCDLKKDNVSQEPDYYGYLINNTTFKLDDDIAVWFGTQYDLWALKGCPVSIQFWSESEDVNFDEKIKELKIPSCFLFDNDDYHFFYIPFDINQHSERKGERLSKMLEKEITNVIEKLKIV